MSKLSFITGNTLNEWWNNLTRDEKLRMYNFYELLVDFKDELTEIKGTKR